jgi:hypothetical protein
LFEFLKPRWRVYVVYPMFGDDPDVKVPVLDTWFKFSACHAADQAQVRLRNMTGYTRKVLVERIRPGD